MGCRDFSWERIVSIVPHFFFGFNLLLCFFEDTKFGKVEPLGCQNQKQGGIKRNIHGERILAENVVDIGDIARKESGWGSLIASLPKYVDFSCSLLILLELKFGSPLNQGFFHVCSCLIVFSVDISQLLYLYISPGILGYYFD